MFDRHSREHVSSRLRLREYNYSTPGIYFVTMCTEHRRCLFGTVEHGEVQLSRAGVVIESWLYDIARWFPGVSIDVATVMPNHVHVLLALTSDSDGRQVEGTPSVSTLIQWFKTKTTYDYTIGVRTDGWPPFPGRLWQRGFHDRIVRSERELDRFRRYIVENPARWTDDSYNPDR